MLILEFTAPNCLLPPTLSHPTQLKKKPGCDKRPGWFFLRSRASSGFLDRLRFGIFFRRRWCWCFFFVWWWRSIFDFWSFCFFTTALATTAFGCRRLTATGTFAGTSKQIQFRQFQFWQCQFRQREQTAGPLRLAASGCGFAARRGRFATLAGVMIC